MYTIDKVSKRSDTTGDLVNSVLGGKDCYKSKIVCHLSFCLSSCFICHRALLTQNFIRSRTEQTLYIFEFSIVAICFSIEKTTTGYSKGARILKRSNK